MRLPHGAFEGKLTAPAYSTPDGWGRLLTAEPNPLLRIIPVAMTDTDADRYRKEAEECRKQAERSASQLDKDYWLRLAADWINLAENAEQRRSKFFGRAEALRDALAGHGIFGTIFRGAH